MQASVATILGIIIGILVLRFTRRRRPVVPGWLALAFGIVAAAALVLGLNQTPQTSNVGNVGLPFLLVSIALAVAALVTAIGALRRARTWPAWAGFVIGLFPALFWIVFALGHVFGGE